MYYFPSKGTLVLMALAAIAVQDTIASTTYRSSTVTDSTASTTITAKTATDSSTATTATSTTPAPIITRIFTTPTTPGATTTETCICTTQNPDEDTTPGTTVSTTAVEVTVNVCIDNDNDNDNDDLRKDDGLGDILCAYNHIGYCQKESEHCPGGKHIDRFCYEAPCRQCCTNRTTHLQCDNKSCSEITVPGDADCKAFGGVCINDKYHQCPEGFGNAGSTTCDGPPERKCCVPNGGK